MALTSDILITPVSGFNYIDALLDSGPDWNFLTTDGTDFRSTLYYTFSTAGTQYETAWLQAFNNQQITAVRSILQQITSITGIQFAESSNEENADLHFAAANIDGSASGICYSFGSYSYSGTTLKSYSADVYVYLDNDYANIANAYPQPGSWGYQVLLHEIGHALGLKHPFEGDATVPTVLQSPYVDTTAYTVMSYTHTSSAYYSTYNQYDVASLRYLYGTDGLDGSWGMGTQGEFITDTALSSQIQLPAGRVAVADLGGLDTVVYAASSSAFFTLHTAPDGHWFQVVGDGVEHWLSLDIERLQFTDKKLALDLLPTGNAGMALEFIGMLGPSFLTAPATIGDIMSYFDAGWSMPGLCQLAVDIGLTTALAGSGSNEDLVRLVYRNVIGSEASSDTLDGLMSYMDGRSADYSQAEFLNAVAELEVTQQRVNLVGLQQTGVEFL
ncbi:MAG: hypothetical protein PHN92_13120 [Geobacter sp.]|nr:hypothetical protein [Geobacter sp.]